MIVRLLKSLKMTLSLAIDMRQKLLKFQRLVAFSNTTEELMNLIINSKKKLSEWPLKNNQTRLITGWATALSKVTKDSSWFITSLRLILSKSNRMQNHKISKRLVISWCLFIASDNKPSCKMTLPKRGKIHDLGNRLGAKVAHLRLPHKAYKMHPHLIIPATIKTLIRWSSEISNGKRRRHETKLIIVI